MFAPDLINLQAVRLLAPQAGNFVIF